MELATSRFSLLFAHDSVGVPENLDGDEIIYGWMACVFMRRKVERRNGAAEGRGVAWWVKWSRTVLGIAILSIVLLWAILPLLLESPDIVLTLSVKSITDIDCPGACYSLEVRNGGPWPIAVNIKNLTIYPSLIGPEVSVNWLGSEPSNFISLAPFTEHTYVFLIHILGGLSPPNRVYVILTANVTVLYVSYNAVLHSGKR